MAGQRFSGLEKGLDMLVISGGKSLNFTEFVALVRGIANLFNDRLLLPFDKWRDSMGNLKLGDIVFFGHEQRLGKGECKLARVKEFWPRGGPSDLPYTSKDLEEKKVLIQRLMLIQPVEVPNVHEA